MLRRPMSRLPLFIRSPVYSLPLLLALGGCAVGPDFSRPETPAAVGYVAGRDAAASLDPSGAQRVVVGAPVDARWWTAFGSPALNALVERAFAANPNVAAAQAALKQAQELVYAQQGYYYPVIQASYSPSRTKLAGNQGGNSPGVQGDGSVISTTSNTPASQGGSAPFNAPVIYNFHTAQLTVGFVADVFGGNRRQVESFQAQAEAQSFALEATYITLASNVVAAAIQEASLRAQIGAVERTVALNGQALDILRRQLSAGYASALDVAAVESGLAQSEQQLPLLKRQLEQTRDLLRVLVGITPDQELDESFQLSSLTLPAELPLSLPSQLVDQRPDVRAAEAQLHFASAQVGVAVANRLPQLSLNASLGGGASHFNQMFWDSGKFFTVAGAISQTLFDGGTLRHRQSAAEQALAQAAAQYRSTVLTAFQNVADTLHALHADDEVMKAALRNSRAADDALKLVRTQQTLGYAAPLSTIAAELNQQQAVISLAQARASQLGDTAALFQALGGGWWNRIEASRPSAARD